MPCISLAELALGNLIERLADDTREIMHGELRVFQMREYFYWL